LSESRSRILMLVLLRYLSAEKLRHSGAAYETLWVASRDFLLGRAANHSGGALLQLPC
jgi:hypothetical protein